MAFTSDQAKALVEMDSQFHDDYVEWLSENIGMDKKRWSFTRHYAYLNVYKFFFADENDAIMFKLRFSENICTDKKSIYYQRTF